MSCPPQSGAISRGIVLPLSALWILIAIAAAILVPGRASAQTSPCPSYSQPVTLTPTLPNHFTSLFQQQGANCMAWQSFISLNWTADPQHPGQPDPNAKPSSFGAPGDVGQTVWQSYIGAREVFDPPAKVPTWDSKRPALMVLNRLSKQGPTDLGLSGIKQAGGPYWLTDQRGGLTYYEVRINQDEYDYITQNGLTTFAGQSTCVQNGIKANKGGLALPGGGGTKPDADLDLDCSGNAKTYGTNVGAIEIKASWIVLPSDHSLDYRYKTSLARIQPPIGPSFTATVGLVGLHIIHKVQGAQQFVWATFEQIDNSPDEAANGGYTAPTLPSNANQKPLGSKSYTFFNPNCTSTSDPTYNCVHNLAPGKPCIKPDTPKNCSPYSAPMQVTRLVPVDSTFADPTTGYAWSLLPSQSVFNYYRLINVQWPNQPVFVSPGSQTPLTNGGITPNAISAILADTTMETYQQKKNSCMDCHQYAPIAHQSQQATALFAGRQKRLVTLTGLAGPTAPFASDYSFLFSSETVR